MAIQYDRFDPNRLDSRLCQTENKSTSHNETRAQTNTKKPDQKPKRIPRAKYRDFAADNVGNRFAIYFCCYPPSPSAPPPLHTPQPNHPLLSVHPARTGSLLLFAEYLTLKLVKADFHGTHTHTHQFKRRKNIHIYKNNRTEGLEV